MGDQPDGEPERKEPAGSTIGRADKRRSWGRHVGLVIALLLCCGLPGGFIGVVASGCWLPPLTSTLEPFPPDVEVVTNNWENKAEDGYNIGPARKITFRSTQGESSKQMQDRIEHIYGSRNWGTGGDSALRFGQGGPGEAFVQYGRWC